jgi:hypothetical protein
MLAKTNASKMLVVVSNGQMVSTITANINIFYYVNQIWAVFKVSKNIFERMSKSMNIDFIHLCMVFQYLFQSHLK